MAIVKHESAPREVEMNPATMIQAIVDKGITAESVGVMKDLIAMQREMKAEAAKASFAKAFADVRRECGKILATKTIPTRDGGIKGRFAPVTEIQDQIEPLLERHGFFMTFDQERLEGGLTRVVCVVVHRDGHEMRSGFTCREHQSPQNSPAQNDGGTNTLAKRYAMCNMFGIRIDYEADAGAEGGTITPKQAEELRARAGRVYGGDEERMNRLLKFAGASTWEAITESKYAQAMKELDREESLGAGASEQSEHKPAHKPISKTAEVTKAVAEWSGFQKEDIRAAVLSVKRAAGVTRQVSTDEDLDKMLAFVEANKNKKFEEVCK